MISRTLDVIFTSYGGYFFAEIYLDEFFFLSRNESKYCVVILVNRKEHNI